MYLPEFFATHPVFRLGDLSQFMQSHGSTNPATRQASLAYHLKRGHIIRIRRGLYASVPRGPSPQEHTVDPIHLAAKATDDAVLGYKTALQVHLRDSKPGHTLTYLTAMSLGPPFQFQGRTYRGTLHPKALQDPGIEDMEVETRSQNGLRIRMTSLERTLVDILDRPILTGRWIQIWRLLSRLPPLDGQRVLTYVQALGNATTASKVGFFLSQPGNKLDVAEEVLEALKKCRPSSPHYMDRLYGLEGRLISTWNLIVPEVLLVQE